VSNELVLVRVWRELFLIVLNFDGCLVWGGSDIRGTLVAGFIGFVQF
jgi:hypothetical protein